MVVADLHVHTTNSDGTLTLEEIPAAARAADVRVVAVTDHDRLHPDLRTPVAHVDGVTLVSGLELRVESDAGRVDLLGYGARRTDALTRELDRLQVNRVERARAIVERCEGETGVALDVALEPGVGRPHIARAVDESDAPYDYQGAFDHLIGNGGPCYVPRDLPTFETGVDLLADACGLVGLAHPLRYDDPAAALALTSELGAVEYHYPYGHEVDHRPVERAIDAHGLVVTGGSDAHDRTLGRAGLDREEYRLFRNRVRLHP
ncbi:PHP domain-containing protein [Halomarina ordinaria]|uniref:PHP domain-containing protein n=1 Tax=Halomarina ordinaria TaxID=3033939 RepID=A0ABD5UGX6_9EURY|nr:PHP domain-containing protein [Halomarina sp. PSRA2]